jgi:hypothetical protein
VRRLSAGCESLYFRVGQIVDRAVVNVGRPVWIKSLPEITISGNVVGIYSLQAISPFQLSLTNSI